MSFLSDHSDTKKVRSPSITLHFIPAQCRDSAWVINCCSATLQLTEQSRHERERALLLTPLQLLGLVARLEVPKSSGKLATLQGGHFPPNRNNLCQIILKQQLLMGKLYIHLLAVPLISSVQGLYGNQSLSQLT